MKRQRELLDAYAASSSRPGLTILPDTTNLARRRDSGKHHNLFRTPESATQ